MARHQLCLLVTIEAPDEAELDSGDLAMEFTDLIEAIRRYKAEAPTERSVARLGSSRVLAAAGLVAVIEAVSGPGPDFEVALADAYGPGESGRVAIVEIEGG